jgi:Animal haem peroxidase
MYDQADRARTSAPRNGLLQRLGLLGTEGKRRRRVALSLSVATSLLFGGFVTTSGGLPSSALAPVGAGFELDAGDLRFILKQITIAETHVATDPSDCAALLGPDVNTQVVEPRLPYGLRMVDGRCNHLTPGTSEYGAADIVFPRLTEPVFQDADAVPPGFGPPGVTSYNTTGPTANVFDAEPRLISNLIVDQSDQNPAAVIASGGCTEREGFDGPDADSLADTCFTGNTAPDAGLSAPFNSMFTFFGQFFDHGLDLVNKGGNGTVFVPLQPDDKLYNPDLDGPDNDPGTGCGAPGQSGGCLDNPFNFLTLTRATSVAGFNEANNQTTSYVDQNQTYT